MQNLCTCCCEPKISLKIKEREVEKRKGEGRRGEGKEGKGEEAIQAGSMLPGIEEARVELGHRGRKGAWGKWPSPEEQERGDL